VFSWDPVWVAASAGCVTNMSTRAAWN